MRHVGRRVARAEELAIELRRRDAGDDGAIRANRLAARQANGRGPPIGDEHPLDLRAGAYFAAAVADDGGESVDERDTSSLRHRHPSELERAGDDLGHEAGGRLVGAEAGVEHPRCEKAVCCLGLERVAEPIAATRENAADVLEETATAEAPERLAPEPETGG